jgi:hypothetical protein
MTRRKTILAIAWFVVLWPLVQIVLVEVAYTNPWRLMGFAMYATEHDVKVTLKKHVAGGAPADVEPRDLPPPAREAYDDFVAKRAVLGRLHSPSSFVETWRRVDPTLAGAVVDVEIEVLRLEHARMTTVARDRLSL